MIILKAEIKIQQKFKCDLCGVEKYGDPITFEAINKNAAHELLDGLPPPSPHDMPLYWGSYGKTIDGRCHTIFKCEKCQGEK